MATIEFKKQFSSRSFTEGFPSFQSSFPEWCEDERSHNLPSSATEQLMGFKYAVHDIETMSQHFHLFYSVITTFLLFHVILLAHAHTPLFRTLQIVTYIDSAV